MDTLSKEVEESLLHANLEDVPLFSLNGYITLAKLVSNYDGDTGDIIFPYLGNLIHMKARFTGYDTCEIKPSKSDPHRLEKKEKAQLAKLRLWNLCTNTNTPGCQHSTLIYIKCGEFDKYGRLLVIAFPRTTDASSLSKSDSFDISINKQMIAEGHGYIYDGGKKSTTFGTDTL